MLFPFAAQSQTFYTITNSMVPDDGTVLIQEIEVSGLPVAINSSFGLTQVCFNMDHSYTSDMDVRLMAPDGTLFQLFSAVGGDGDNFTDCCLRSDASSYMYENAPPFTGTFLPSGNMGLVNNGQDPNGPWSLILTDVYPFADQGILYDWSLSFGIDAPGPPYDFDSTNLPIVKLQTGGQYIPDEPKVMVDMKIIQHADGSANHFYDTEYDFEGEVLVELQGFTGPSYPKKNYDFDIVNEEGLEINASLLGLPEENDFILKAEYLDPTLMYNNIAYSFARKMGRYAPRLLYCELFIDGEYMGVFSLTEKIKRDSIRVDIAKLTPEDIVGDSLTGGYIIEMNINGDAGAWNSEYLPVNYATSGQEVQFKHVYPKASEIMPEQAEYIHAYVDSFENVLHDYNFDHPINGYRKFIDEETFIDFMLVNEMSTNYDSYGRSTFMYKEKITDDGKLKIGPPWDYDRGFCCVEDWVWEETHPYWPFPDWWTILNSDTSYTNRVWCRWNELRSSTWSDEAFMGHIDSLHGYLAEAGIRNYDRWPELGVSDWNSTVIDLKNRLQERLNWMDTHITGNGPCVPSLVNNSIHVEDFEGEIFPPTCWKLEDADGDNMNWNGAQPVTGYDSPHTAFSYSFTGSTQDNYLILPQLSPLEGEHLSWNVSTIGESDLEHYQVLLSTSGNEPENFTEVLFEETCNGSWWRYRAADLSPWWGEDIYIAFRHISDGGNFLLKLDDVRYPTWTNEDADCTITVNDVSKGNVQLYPNPFSDLLIIENQGTSTISKAVLRDTPGKTILEMNQKQGTARLDIDTAALASGLYTLEVFYQGGTSAIFKVMKR